MYKLTAAVDYHGDWAVDWLTYHDLCVWAEYFNDKCLTFESFKQAKRACRRLIDKYLFRYYRCPWARWDEDDGYTAEFAIPGHSMEDYIEVYLYVNEVEG